MCNLYECWATHAAGVRPGRRWIRRSPNPGLSGPDLAKSLALARPETRVLYTSGYIDDAIVSPAVLGPDCAFLEKPFGRDALVRKVRELLDSPVSVGSCRR